MHVTTRIAAISLISLACILIAVLLLVVAALNQHPGHRATVAVSSNASAPTPILTYTHPGGVQDVLVGPGPTPGSQRVYVSYTYALGTFDLVGIDPDTGAYQLYSNPLTGEEIATLGLGDDGDIYLATRGGGHLMRLNTASGTLTDLGRPAPTESYIWSLATGANHKLYGGTYPNAHLVSYDPATERLDDLGPMYPTQHYASSVAASSDGYVYLGIGDTTAHLVAYNTASGQHEDILPPQYQLSPGTANVWKASDGRIYAQVGSHELAISGLTAVAVSTAPPPAARDALQDGSTVAISSGSITVTDAATGQSATHAMGYPGEPLKLFHLAMGPDDKLYVSTEMNNYLLQVDAASGRVINQGQIGGGENFSMLALSGTLLIGSYGSATPLQVYDPRQPFAPGAAPGSNPLGIDFRAAGWDQNSWRPYAMIRGPDGKVYVGSQNGYGVPGGALTVWDTATNAIRSYDQPIAGESVTALAVGDGQVVGGTSIFGGNGTTPTQASAHLFVWDPTAQRVVYQIVPFVNEPEVSALATAPSGKIYGVAGWHAFVFDPAQRQITQVIHDTFAGVCEGCLGVGPDGNIWGVSQDGVFKIDTGTNTSMLVAPLPTPGPVFGFAISQSGMLYFSTGGQLWHYQIGA